MKKGVIIKGIGGFYYVKSEGKVYECKARGKFRKDNISPLVGDKVIISTEEDKDTGIIEEILERKVELFRPPVANVDQAIIVISIKKPEPNFKLLDKLLILGEHSNLELSICINKIDLDAEKERELFLNIYKNTGYNLIFTSIKSNEGIDMLKDILKDKITVFAGPSGVGKSSLLNTIQEGLRLKTGEISRKISRGKHTTRHCELLELDFGGWVVDTPGFTSINIDFIEPEELQKYYPEFRNISSNCKFSDCIHINEPGCCVKREMEMGNISKNRYENYIYFINELTAIKNRR